MKEPYREAELWKKATLTALRVIKESGNSSWMYLQNVTGFGKQRNQEVAYALAMCDIALNGRGAYLVHRRRICVELFRRLFRNDMLAEFKKSL